MNIIEIPFAKIVGLEKPSNNLVLSFRPEIMNHLEGIHASAVFMLAESASGEFLKVSFPNLEGKVVPVLREAQVKFRKPAMQNIYAVASLDENRKNKFLEQMSVKGRSLIAIDVYVYDQDETLILKGLFNWFVQVL